MNISYNYLLMVVFNSLYKTGTVYSNNGRRKNATRETTAALKAWLKEHRKNPYPTKAEKIMLAIKVFHSILLSASLSRKNTIPYDSDPFILCFDFQY
jgi:hypothetical protein